MNRIAYSFRRFWILFKVAVISLLPVRIGKQVPKLTHSDPAAIEVRSSRRKLRALEAALRKNPQAFSHTDYLKMLTLRAIVNSNKSNKKNLNKDLDDIIKLCIDWKARYKEHK